MLELNKEYTYKEICRELRWSESAGNSKKAQIKEIEDAFEFYHPINRKTHKEKKSYIFTRQLREVVEPSKKNCGGAHNIKSIKSMMDFLMMLPDEYIDDTYKSITAWLCDVLQLMNREPYNIPYEEKSRIEKYCAENEIKNVKLFCDYISAAKTIMKRTFINSLESMKKKNMVLYDDGYIFSYQLGKKTLGQFATDELNDIIKQNEIVICDGMNENYLMSKKMKGRQLLFIIYSNEKYMNEFNDAKTAALMSNKDAMEIIKECIDNINTDYGDVAGRTYIDEDHPLLSYYRGIALGDIEPKEYRPGIEMDICDEIRIKARKAILNKHYKNKRTGRKIYPYDKFECAEDIVKIEKLLYRFYNANLVDETALDLVDLEDDEELNEIFGGVWGEPEPEIA